MLKAVEENEGTLLNEIMLLLHASFFFSDELHRRQEFEAKLKSDNAENAGKPSHSVRS